MKKRLGRFLKISLRGLLTVVLICAAVSGWIGSKRLQSQRQTKSIAALRELSLRHSMGSDRWSEHSAIVYDSGPAEQRSPRGQWMPNWLRRVTGEECFHRVVRVNLPWRRIQDKELLPLKNLTDLESVNLEGNEVSDDVASYLAHLHSLRHLCLGGTKITAQCLAKLQSLKNLRELELWETDLGDEMIDYVNQMSQVQRINLCQTRVTREGVAKLQGSLPDCRIWWDGTEAIQLINGCPHPLGRPEPNQPNPAAIVRAVNHLVSLGKENAIETLREYVRVAPNRIYMEDPRSPADQPWDQQKVCILLPLLFERTDPQQGIPDPPCYIPGAKPTTTTSAEWPDFNVSLEGDIPFLNEVIDLRRYWGTFPFRNYLVEWAAANCRFRSQPLRPDNDPFAAAERVAAADSLSRRYLQEQAQRMTAHLKITGTSHAKIHWSEQQQQYAEGEPHKDSIHGRVAQDGLP